MALTLEQTLARVPMWKNARDIKTTPLGGGITNQNFRVDIGGESFVLRIGGADTELLGINRQHEYAANVAAATIGIAPEVIYFMEPEGYLVTRFLNARPIPRDEISQPENIRRVAHVLKQIHALPVIPGAFSPFRTIEDYAATARRYSVAFPANFDWLMSRLREIEAVFARESFVPRPCHNDLLNENFLDDGNIRIIDWEYAGMGDPAFDLANFAVHHGLDEEQDKFLLVEYFGEVTVRRVARHTLMKIASDVREAMWAMVQIGISKLDFDFRGYADKHFARGAGMIREARYLESLQKF
ncbi:MAG: phosphotransferase family protein [Chloroflexi bacterium]|nr:phosphotransferase family protein [Chloroflexota bacterium]